MGCSLVLLSRCFRWFICVLNILVLCLSVILLFLIWGVVCLIMVVSVFSMLKFMEVVMLGMLIFIVWVVFCGVVVVGLDDVLGFMVVFSILNF